MNYKITIPERRAWKMVTGRLIKIEGFRCGIHFDKECDSFTAYPTWIVTELSTGAVIDKDITRKGAVAYAREKLKENGIERVNKAIGNAAKYLKKIHLPYPLNP